MKPLDSVIATLTGKYRMSGALALTEVKSKQAVHCGREVLRSTLPHDCLGNLLWHLVSSIRNPESVHSSGNHTGFFWPISADLKGQFFSYNRCRLGPQIALYRTVLVAGPWRKN